MAQSKNTRIAWALIASLSGITAGCSGWTNRAEQVQAERVAQPSRWGTPSVYTPANRSAGEAIRAHFGVRAETRQPFAFSHRIHLEKELACTDCHEGVERGPVAGLPGVSTCMICHSQIATDTPLVKSLAGMQEQGLDLSWQRVYGFTRDAHVRFEHAAHVRSGVECSTCHGNMRTQTVAERVVDMDMAFCVNCHKQKQASNDCLTCHY